MKTRTRNLLAVMLVLVLGLFTLLWLRFWPLMRFLMERKSEAAEIQIHHVNGNIYLLDATLEGRQVGGSVAASLGPDGVLLVDSLTSENLARQATSALERLGGGLPRLVINTHPHPDHVLGNAYFSASARLLAHRQTRKRLAEPARPFPWLPSVSPFAEEALPEAISGDTHRLDFNGETVELWHFGPGHTDGDLFVYFTGSRVVHTGDAFHGRGGHSAADAKSGGNILGLHRNLGALLARLPEDVKIIGGHGGVGQLSSRRDLEGYHQLLGEILERMQEGLKNGLGREAVLAQALPPNAEPWFADARDDSVMHGPPEPWLEAIYKLLGGEKRLSGE